MSIASILFLPGASGRRAFWQPAASRLSDLAPTLLLGWPGFAGEPRDPAVCSLVDLVGWTLARMPSGPCDIVAQSMGGIVAMRIALDFPERVRRLVLVATSGGVDVARLGAIDWRSDYVAEYAEVPRWFVDDRTDITDRLASVRCPTLLVWGDEDPISPVAVGELLRDRLPDARLVVLAGGTHMLAEERAEEVAPLIRAHLAEEL